MPLYDDEFDCLIEAQRETEQVAGEMSFASDLDRRKFVHVHGRAAASTFGFGARALAQGRGGGGAGSVRRAQDSSVPLDNMEQYRGHSNRIPAEPARC